MFQRQQITHFGFHHPCGLSDFRQCLSALQSVYHKRRSWVYRHVSMLWMIYMHLIAQLSQHDWMGHLSHGVSPRGCFSWGWTVKKIHAIKHCICKIFLEAIFIFLICNGSMKYLIFCFEKKDSQIISSSQYLIIIFALWPFKALEETWTNIEWLLK